MIAKRAHIKPVARVMLKILFDTAQVMKICTAVESVYISITHYINTNEAYTVS